MKSKGMEWAIWMVAAVAFLGSGVAWGSEAQLALPAAADRLATFDLFGWQAQGGLILSVGLLVCLAGMGFGWWQFRKLTDLPVHQSMRDVSTLIYGTCQTYLMQQAKLLGLLFILIGGTMIFYFGVLQKMPMPEVGLVLLWALIGMAGSFAVAWFGILINNVANSRMAFAALRGKAMALSEIPTRSGMSIGVLLISVELVMMLVVLKFVSPALAGVCFLGFAIGESLGASVLRICGGIFTKIADVGSDMMKIVFGIKEDDARNPGVIADCAGDNAGDSVGPTADGFETYGVTGVALISFIVLAVPEAVKQWELIVWIFTMRILMVALSVGAWWINGKFARAAWGSHDRFNFEHPLTTLVWFTSLLCIGATYLVSWSMLGSQYPEIWWKLATIISCGTLAAAVIPEATRAFTSTGSAHCQEIVDASREGGTGLTILSGLVAGFFSAFWKGLVIALLMLAAYLVSTAGGDAGLASLMGHPSVFGLGLLAFGMLGMGPVTIAVDSYGPVTDNAQSVFELSMIEQLPNIKEDIQKEFGFVPNFETGKEMLEENDGAGNTFKATAKPMLIGTAVVGATTMIFSLILMLQKNYDPQIFTALSVVDPRVLLGLIAGGGVVFWFCGASIQAVSTGAYRAVDYIKKHIRLDGTEKASAKDSNEVVRICTQFAQQGMVNIFVVIFCFALGFACLNPVFFCAYLISIAVFGLFAAIFMANAGGCWDNAKKIVEVNLKQKGTELHASTVVGDIVGDPFKDTSSVALNPIIKFTTLFGILAVEISVMLGQGGRGALSQWIGCVFVAVALVFVWRSFYKMRITSA